MSESSAERAKVLRLGLERTPGYMYFVRNRAVWRVKSGVGPVPPEKVVDVELYEDAGYLYFVDADGDISRVKRVPGGPGSPAPLA